MKNQPLITLLTKLSTLPHLPTPSHPLLTLHSLSTPTQSCSRCQTHQQILKDLSSQLSETTEKYNALLEDTLMLMEMNYQLFGEQERKFGEAVEEMERERGELETRVGVLQGIVREGRGTIDMFGRLLLEKDQIIAALQQKLEQTDNLSQPQPQSPGPSTNPTAHRRQKSSLYPHIEKLTQQNSQLKEENRQLQQKLEELEFYVKRMEEDLADVNVKSPRILDRFGDRGQGEGSERSGKSGRSAGSGESLKKVEQCSIEAESPIAQSQAQQKSQSDWPRHSLTSSFAPGSRPLRQILNITGQSSNYFNFRTKQKFQQSNAFHTHTDGYSSANNNNENDPSLANVLPEMGRGPVKIMEIKEFQVVDGTGQKQTRVSNKEQGIKDTKKAKEEGSPCIWIDPYYAFFTLTIQCLKLNWRDLNEVANITMDEQWGKLMAQQIPINRWGEYLGDVLRRKVLGLGCR